MAHRSPFSSTRILVVFSAVALGAIGTGCSSSDTGDGVGGSGGGTTATTGTTTATTSTTGTGVGGDGGGGGAGPEACDMLGAFRACELPGDPAGAPSGGQECTGDPTGSFWNECQEAGTASSTPLVLSFDGAPVQFAGGAQAAFDLTGTMSVVTDWPAAATPWLALDRDGNGAIDDGSELFGSATALRGGERATNGFVALAELDSNQDGRITPDDAAWSSLRIWSDGDGDRVSVTSELTGLLARRLLSIDLGYTSARKCDLRGNCEIERASFRFVDEAGVEHTGAIVDVHLKHR